MVKVLVPPASEPVSTAELQNYVHLEETQDTNEIAFRKSLIAAAREYCEGIQRRAFITQTLEISLSKFPVGEIALPRGNLQTVNSVKYTDYSGTEHLLSSGIDYVVSTRGVLGRISPPYGKTWPTDALYPLDPIVIEFTCGYGDNAEDVPCRVKQAMCMLISYWYDNRSAVLIGSISKELEFAVRALLRLDRIAVI